MDIAFLVDTLSIEKGTGIARYSNHLINGLQRAGYKVDCIYPGAPDDPMAGIYGHAVKLPFKIYKNKNNYDVFHANSPVTGLGLLLTKKPKIVNYNDLASILYPPEANLHVKKLAPYFYKIGKYCDKVVCISTQTKQELIEYLKFSEEKIVVINLGVDDIFYPIPKMLRGYFTIGYVGKVSARKRIDFLINAFYHFRKRYSDINIKLSICGKKTSYHADLQKMVYQLGLSKDVEFIDFVPDDQLNLAYNSFDIMAIPSEWEGFGIPILEAQRCGIPTIIRENAHIPLEVSKCCIKCKSEKNMADLIFNILTNDEHYTDISKRGIEYSKTFTWDKMVSETISLYNEILND